MDTTPNLDFNIYTVAWIAPREIEAQAAWYMLDNVHQGNFSISRGDDYVYTAGDINGHNVVIATFPADHDYGVGSAAALAGQVKKSFPNLWFGLLVGVAAGLPNLDRIPPRDIRLGDILVGLGGGGNAGLVSYGLGKETSGGFELLRDGAQAKTETVLRAAIGNIKTFAPMRGNDFLKYYKNIKDKKHSNGTFADPGQKKDKFYQIAAMDDLTLVERQPRQESERTQVWYGRVGSGDKLVENARKREELRDRFDLIGLEMEAAGTMNTIPVAVIRGACGYGDAQKNEEWQPYAAAMAAAYTKGVLYTITPKNTGDRSAAHKSMKIKKSPVVQVRQGCSTFSGNNYGRNINQIGNITGDFSLT
jgi:nucleoside phosphorylase